MTASGRRMAALFVDRTTRQWVVRGPEGRYWVLPPEDNAWDKREPFHLADETDLEPVPWHYKNLLGLPF